MSYDNPFEAERRRRAEALEQDEKARTEALEAEAAKDNPQSDPEALRKHLQDVYGLAEDRIKAFPDPHPQLGYLTPEQVRDAFGLDGGVFVKRIGDDRAYQDAHAKDVAMESYRMRQMDEDYCKECDDSFCLCGYCDKCEKSPCECAAIEREKARRKAKLAQSDPVGPNAPGIGGWRPGQHKPETHEHIRFEIEAERALFMGKPVPTDPELRQMHLKLNDMHRAYQRTGDTAMLIAIADLQAEYNVLAAENAKRRNR
jgi:hypothetical protein